MPPIATDNRQQTASYSKSNTTLIRKKAQNKHQEKMTKIYYLSIKIDSCMHFFFFIAVVFVWLRMRSCRCILGSGGVTKGAHVVVLAMMMCNTTMNI